MRFFLGRFPWFSACSLLLYDQFICADGASNDLVKLMIKFFYFDEYTYLDYENQENDNDPLAPFSLHASMSTLAQLYGVRDLEDHAIDNYEDADWDRDCALEFADFLASVRIIYESTPADDTRLRKLAKRIAVKYFRH